MQPLPRFDNEGGVNIPNNIVNATHGFMAKGDQVGEPEFKVLDGPGTGTSDSIHTTLPEQGFVITAAAMQMFGPDFFKRLVDAVPADPASEEMGEEHMEVRVSDGEGFIPPEVVEFYGAEFFDKINATASGGAPENSSEVGDEMQEPMEGGEPMVGEDPEGFKKGGKVGCYVRGGILQEDKKPVTASSVDAPNAGRSPGDFDRSNMPTNTPSSEQVMQGQRDFGAKVDAITSPDRLAASTKNIVGSVVAQGSENLMRGTGNLIDTAGKGFSKIGEMLNPVSAAEGTAKNVGNIVGGSDNIKELNAQPAVGQFRSNLDAAGNAAWEGAKERVTWGNGLAGVLAAPINAANKGIQAFNDNDQYQKTMSAEAARNNSDSPSYKYEPENQGVLQDVVKQRQQQAQVGANPQQTQVQPVNQQAPDESKLKAQVGAGQTPPVNKGIATRAVNQVSQDYQVGVPKEIPSGNSNVVNLSGDANWNAPNKPGQTRGPIKVDPWYSEQDYRAAAYGEGKGAEYDKAVADKTQADAYAQNVKNSDANTKRELDQYDKGIRGKQDDEPEGKIATNPVTGESEWVDTVELKRKKKMQQLAETIAENPESADVNDPDQQSVLRNLTTNTKWLASPQGQRYIASRKNRNQG